MVLLKVALGVACVISCCADGTFSCRIFNQSCDQSVTVSYFGFGYGQFPVGQGVVTVAPLCGVSVVFAGASVGTIGGADVSGGPVVNFGDALLVGVSCGGGQVPIPTNGLPVYASCNVTVSDVGLGWVDGAWVFCGVDSLSASNRVTVGPGSSVVDSFLFPMGTNVWDGSSWDLVLGGVSVSPHHWQVVGCEGTNVVYVTNQVVKVLRVRAKGSSGSFPAVIYKKTVVKSQ